MAAFTGRRPILGSHALNTLEYDLAAELEPWQPPQPFDDHTWSSPNRVFTKPELLGYVAHCHQRVRDTLDVLTEAKAALPLPVAHHHHPMTYRALVSSLPLRVVEHAAEYHRVCVGRCCSGGAGPRQRSRGSQGRADGYGARRWIRSRRSGTRLLKVVRSRIRCSVTVTSAS